MSSFSITCTKDNIVSGLSRVVPITGRNVQLPILQHILLKASDGVLHLTATDLELGVHTIVGGKVSGSGSATVPAKSFLSYLQQLPSNEPIVITSKESSLHVKTSGFSAQFPITNGEDFPLLPKGDKKGSITIPSSILCSSLQQVIFSAARDETRPEIRGVYVYIQGDEVRVAATDSFRLAERVISRGGVKEEESFVLPLASAQEIVRLFASEDEVHIAPQDSYVLFYCDDIDVTSRLIDGVYPDYRQIIPQSSTLAVEVMTEEFARALKTLTVFLPRDSRRVELDVRPKEGVIQASVASGGVGEGIVEVPIKGKGDSVKVIVNIQYIIEGLQHIHTPETVIGLSGDTSPITIKPKEDGYVYVVMPIRT